MEGRYPTSSSPEETHVSLATGSGSLKLEFAQAENARIRREKEAAMVSGFYFDMDYDI